MEWPMNGAAKLSLWHEAGALILGVAVLSGCNLYQELSVELPYFGEPIVTMVSAPAARARETRADFVFECDRLDCRFECRLDTEELAPCTSPVRLEDLGDGEHSFSVRAIDQVDTVGPTVVHRWTVDTVRPVVTLRATPPEVTDSVTASFQFSCDKPDCAMRCAVDDQPADVCVSPFRLIDLADGAHTLRIESRDGLGNEGEPVSFGWTVDTVKPVVTIASAPPARTREQIATFAFECNKPDCRLSCSLDRGEYADCPTDGRFEGLEPGERRLAVRGSDEAGNVGEPTQHVWFVDTIAPTVSFEQAPLALVRDNRVSFLLRCSETDCTYACQLDGEDLATCPQAFDLTELADGPYRLEVRATDDVGNEGSAAVHNWGVDTVPPVVTIAVGPEVLSNRTTANFHIECSEPGCRLQCRLDGNPVPGCAPDQPLFNLGEGPHSVEVWAEDPAGNVGPSVRHDWVVDTTGPTVSVVQRPQSATASPQASIALGCSEEDCTYECSLDGEPFASCESQTALAALTHGPHEFRVRAIDAALNTGASTTVSWSVDLVAPESGITLKPPALTNAVEALFNFSCYEAGCTTECRLDNGNYAPCTSPKTYQALGDGQRTFEVRGIDAVGNVGPSQTYGWEIDTRAPEGSVVEAPPARTGTAMQALAFDCDEGPCTYECSLNGPFEACTSPKVYTNLQEGSWLFRVRARDQAGNTGVAAEAQWIVDRTGPTVTLVSNVAAITAATSLALAMSCSEANCVYECSLDGAPYASCEDPLTLADLVHGSHEVRVRATDEAGNTGPGATYLWTVDLVAPESTITIMPSSPTNSRDALLNFACTEPGCTTECRIDAGAFAACTSPKTYQQLGDGLRTFEVRGLDAAGNVGTSAAHTWEIDTRAPIAAIDRAPAAWTRENVQELSFACDEGSCTFECSLNGPFESCTSPVVYTDLQEGSWLFRVRARDTAGNIGASAQSGWVVDRTAPSVTLAPSVAAITSATVLELAMTCSEAGCSYECALDGGEWTACAAPASFANLADGLHQVRVRPTDRAGNLGDERFFAWEIDTVAPVVSLTQKPLATTFYSSATFVFSCDKEPCQFTCAVDAEPPVSCVSPYTRSGLARTSHEMVIVATDSLGNRSADKVHDWQVIAPQWEEITGDIHTICARLADNTTWCWGDNDFNQLNDPALDSTVCPNSASCSNYPVRLKGDAEWRKAEPAESTACGWRSNGQVTCWGQNQFGQLGDNTTLQRLSPGLPVVRNTGEAITDWLDVKIGAYHGCGIRSDQSLWCWGYSGEGQVGKAEMNVFYRIAMQTDAPPGFPGLWEKLSTNWLHSCGIHDGGRMSCWGRGEDGQLGNGTTDNFDVPEPVNVDPLERWIDIDGGDTHTCAMREDTSIWCWGDNQFGQLGLGYTGGNILSPQMVDPGPWAEMSIGLRHGCAIRPDRSLWCWGNNGWGQLGNNSFLTATTPVLVLGNHSWKTVQVGFTHTCAIRDDDSLWCWGNNQFGQVSDNTFGNRKVPTAIVWPW